MRLIYEKSRAGRRAARIADPGVPAADVPAALARRTTAFLLVATTIAAVGLTVAAGPLSALVLGYRDPTTFRVAVLGLWSFTNLELAYGLLRVDERLRMYAVASVSNVLLTVAASVVLVVGEHDIDLLGQRRRH